MKKAVLYVLVKRATIWSLVYISSFGLAINIIMSAPIDIMLRAEKSYLHINSSPKNLIDIKVLKIIPVIILVDISTRSAYGNTKN